MTQEATSIGELLFNALKATDVVAGKGDLVAFKTKNNRKLAHAHSCVLKARSPYFRRILNDSLSLTEPIKVALSDEVFNLLLKYFYLPSTVKIQPHNVLELFSAAKQFDVTDLSVKIKKCFEQNYQEFINSSLFLMNSTVEDILGLPEIFEGIEVKAFDVMNLSSKLMRWTPAEDRTALRLTLSVLEKITKFDSSNIFHVVIKVKNGELAVEKRLFHSDNIFKSWKFEKQTDLILAELAVQMNPKRVGEPYSFNRIIISENLKRKIGENICDGIFEFEMQVYTCITGTIYRLELDDEQEFSLKRVAKISRENVKMLGIYDKTDDKIDVLISERGSHSFQKLTIFSNRKQTIIGKSYLLQPGYAVLTVRDELVYLWNKHSIIAIDEDKIIDTLDFKYLDFEPFKCVTMTNDITGLSLLDEKCVNDLHINLSTMEIVNCRDEF